MPELPEVENVRRRLEPLLRHRTVSALHTTKSSYFFLSSPTLLRRSLPGRTIAALTRRGKYLLLEFTDECRLLLHLGMTGQLLTEGATALASGGSHAVSFEPDAHTHLGFEFSDGGPRLYFRDVRKFGKVKLLGKGQTDTRLGKLGPDALTLDGDALYDATRRRKGPIKSVLLDQGVSAGIGNIYADEALFASGVRPATSARRVSRARCVALATAVRATLERAIALGGSTISDYRLPDGTRGGYQDERRVYGREGEPCLTCGAAIRRTVIGQRSSHYCPGCQR